MEKREQDLLYKIEVGSENIVVPDSLKPENMKKKLVTRKTTPSILLQN